VCAHSDAAFWQITLTPCYYYYYYFKPTSTKAATTEHVLVTCAVASTWGPTLSDFVIKQQRQVAGVSHKRWYYCSSEYWHWTLSGYRQCRLFDFPYSGIDVLTILQLRCAWTAAFETTSHRTDAAYCYTCLTFCGLAVCALGTLSELALQKQTNRSRCRMSLRNHVLDGSALWRHLANATERSVLGGNVALETRQITSTTYLHFIRSMKS